MSMRIQVHDLEFDEWNEDEMWAHRVSADEVRQVLDNAPAFVPNKRAHPAPVVMLGQTYGGRWLTVPLDKTARPAVWRPATAWDSTKAEQARYRADRQRR